VSLTDRLRPDDPAPYYEAHVFACVNERPAEHPRGSCMARGAMLLRNYMKGRADQLGLKNVRINQSGCLDRCELGPVIVIYPEGIWYAPRTREDIDEILEVHLKQGGRVTRLMLQPDQKPPAAE